MVQKIELGNKCKDRVTGLTGIAVAKTKYLQGCDRILVQPPSKDDKVPDAVSFDEEDLVFVSTGIIVKPKPEEPPGGPRPMATRRAGVER